MSTETVEAGTACGVGTRDELLTEYQQTIRGAGGRRSSWAADTLARIWPYLFDRPGEQLAYAEFGKMLGVEYPRESMLRLVKRGIIAQATVRSGRRGGVGFYCNWLEARRRGEDQVDAVRPVLASYPAPESKPEPRSRLRKAGGVFLRLSELEDLAEKIIGEVRPLFPQAPEAGFAVIENMREIQAKVARAMASMKKIGP